MQEDGGFDFQETDLTGMDGCCKLAPPSGIIIRQAPVTMIEVTELGWIPGPAGQLFELLAFPEP